MILATPPTRLKWKSRTEGDVNEQMRETKNEPGPIRLWQSVNVLAASVMRGSAATQTSVIRIIPYTRKAGAWIARNVVILASLLSFVLYMALGPRKVQRDRPPTLHWLPQKRKPLDKKEHELKSITK